MTSHPALFTEINMEATYVSISSEVVVQYELATLSAMLVFYNIYIRSCDSLSTQVQNYTSGMGATQTNQYQSITSFHGVVIQDMRTKM